MKSSFLVSLTILVAGLFCLALGEGVGQDVGQEDGLARPLGADEYTRQAARRVKLKSVKEIRLDLFFDGNQRQLVVTDPKVMQSLIEGLKQATETGISNQTDYVGVIDTNNNEVVYANFSLDYPSHALSPQFIKGLREAGIVVTDWEKQEQAREKTRKLRSVGLFVGGGFLLMLVTLFVVKRKSISSRSTK